MSLNPMRRLVAVVATGAVLVSALPAAANDSNEAEVRAGSPLHLPQSLSGTGRSGAATVRPDITLAGIPLARFSAHNLAGRVISLDYPRARSSMRAGGRQPVFGRRGSRMSHRKRSMLRGALIGAAIGAATGIGAIHAVCRSRGGNCMCEAYNKFGGLFGLAGLGIGTAIGAR